MTIANENKPKQTQFKPNQPPKSSLFPRLFRKRTQFKPNFKTTGSQMKVEFDPKNKELTITKTGDNLGECEWIERLTKIRR